jgi:hypothetical protein
MLSSKDYGKIMWNFQGQASGIFRVRLHKFTKYKKE